MPATKRKFAAPVGLLINSISTVDSSVASTTPSSGAFVITGGVGIGGTANITGSVNLWNSTNTFYTGFRAGTLTTSTFYILPTNFPGTGTSVLQSNTSGTLSWVPMTASGSGTTSANINIVLAGTNASHPVLFTPSSSSSGSAVSSDSTLVYNPSTDILSVAGLAVTAATSSSSTSTGALVVTGGVGIGDSLNVAGNVSINSGTNGLVFRKLVSGNYGAIYSTNITPSSTNYTMITDGASVNFNGTNGVYFNVSNTNKIQVTANNINIVPSVDSISTSTGAFTVAGGVGIGGSLYVGGQNRFSGARNSTSTTSGTVVIDGGLGITGNAFIGGTVNILGQTVISSSLGSTNNTTGALVVTGGLGVSGQLSFVAASMGFTGITYNPTMAFIGNTSSSPITLSVLTDNSLSWEGSSGQLFAIDNNLTTGDIFSVSDISGLPIINASAGQTVSINEFGGFTRIGNGSISSTGASALGANGSLVVYGGIGITGNANIGGTVRVINTTASSGNASGALVVSGGVGIGQSLFVGGNLNLTGTFYSGTNTFTKNLGNGDISLDNGTSDTPSITFYWGNNKNLGIDTYWAGSGVTRFRITKELNEVGGGELWSVDRNGIVTQTAWDVGEVINTRVYNNTDLNMSATTTINSTTYTNVATITYTPKSTTSHLWIEFDAHYDFSNGTTSDDFFSRITVGGSAIVEKNQIMVGQVGGGTRSGTIFPISGRYTNSTTSGIAITVQAKWGSADDAIRVYGSSTSGYMRIQEIGR